MKFLNENGQEEQLMLYDQDVYNVLLKKAEN